MNRYQAKNNIYKNGEYKPSHSKKMVREKAESIEPTRNQVEYRDALYKFCVQKGVWREGTRLGRTRKKINAEIRAFLSVLRKNGLADEFFGCGANTENM